MTALLDAVQGELDAAERRVQQLRAIRDLVAGLDGAGEGAANGASPPPAASGAPPRAVEALRMAYRQLSNIDPSRRGDRWVRDALHTLRTAVFEESLAS